MKKLKELQIFGLEAGESFDLRDCHELFFLDLGYKEDVAKSTLALVYNWKLPENLSALRL